MFSEYIQFYRYLRSKITKNHILWVLSAFVLFSCTSWYDDPNENSRDTFGQRENYSVQKSPLNGLNFYHVPYFKMGNGTRIIFYPGNGRNGSDYNELTQSVSQSGFRTLVLDGGHIYTYDLQVHAGTIRGITMDDGYQTATEKFCLVGNDVSNLIFRTAIDQMSQQDRPLRPSAVVLIGLADSEVTPEAQKKIRQVFHTKAFPFSRIRRAKEIYFAPDSIMPKHWKRDWRNLLKSIYLSFLNDYPTPDWTDITDIPILLIQGEQDAIVPMKRFLSGVDKYFPPQTKIKIIDGAAHALLPEKPEEVNKAVTNFLKQHCEG